MINTHGYGMPEKPETKSFDLDAFHREQMRLTMTKIEDMRGKLQYCMKQIFEMKSRIEWLIDEMDEIKK